ncbi:MAG: helix-turn-helix domain-containing protein [Bacteroidota bacterium]
MNITDNLKLSNSIKSATSYDTQQLFEVSPIDQMAKNRFRNHQQPKRQEMYHIIWVKKGSGEHLIDTQRHQLSDNMIYCVLPKQVLVLKADREMEGYMISFTADFLRLTPNNFNPLFRSGLFGSSTDPAVIKVTGEIENDLHQIVGNMQQEFLKNATLKSEILRDYLKIFLIYLTRQIPRPEEPGVQLSRTELVNRFFNLLQQNFTTKKLVTDYAGMLSVTPNYLNNVVKKVSGYPASHHIRRQLIQEARRQAIYTDKSMKEIAYYLGFETNTHFSKFFKKNEGCNFRHYRRSMRNVLYS